MVCRAVLPQRYVEASWWDFLGIRSILGLPSFLQMQDYWTAPDCARSSVMALVVYR